VTRGPDDLSRLALSLSGSAEHVRDDVGREVGAPTSSPIPAASTLARIRSTWGEHDHPDPDQAHRSADEVVAVGTESVGDDTHANEPATKMPP
jgi:hypothetical protein